MVGASLIADPSVATATALYRVVAFPGVQSPIG
jgi:hypothetical protein